MGTIERTYLSSPFGQIHARVAGDPSKPPVLLLHQVPSSSIMFEKLMAGMAADYYLIAPDLPGFGASNKAPNETIVTYAEMVWQACARCFDRPIHVVGHHFGTAVAAEIARRFGTQIKSLALSGPALLNDEMRAALPKAARPIAHKPDGSHMREMWERIRAKDTHAPLALTERETLLALDLGARYLSAYEAACAYDMEANLRLVECPAFVFAGTEDVLAAAVEPTAACLKSSESTVIEDENGYLFDNNSEAVSALLARFFTKMDT